MTNTKVAVIVVGAVAVTAVVALNVGAWFMTKAVSESLPNAFAKGLTDAVGEDLKSSKKTS
jgi:hypothetical protein